MVEHVAFYDSTKGNFAVDAECLDLRHRNFADDIVFHAPGLKKFATSEFRHHDSNEFVAVSLTGEACALNCEHCKMGVLRGMQDLPKSGISLYEMCSRLHEAGARGVLVSGGSDRRGRVPLKKHIPDLIQIRRDFDLKIRVHPGLPDEETCAGLADVGIDGAMIDVIGSDRTIRDVYHLDCSTDDYEKVLERLQRHGVPCVPHIILGLHFGRMSGEEYALEMISKYDLELLVIVILMPLSGTPMSNVNPPSLSEIGQFFSQARRKLQSKPIMLGCARPFGSMKFAIDQLAVDCGFNGIAYPAEGIVGYAMEKGLKPRFINACCGVSY